VEHIEDAADLAGAAGGANELQRLAVEGDEARGVALFDEEIGKRGGEILGVFDFRERLAVDGGGEFSGVGHRAADIDGEHGAEVGFLDVLADDVAVAAGDDAPVERARIVAGRV
jgi:hypothetical protein